MHVHNGEFTSFIYRFQGATQLAITNGDDTATEQFSISPFTKCPF